MSGNNFLKKAFVFVSALGIAAALNNGFSEPRKNAVSPDSDKFQPANDVDVTSPLAVISEFYDSYNRADYNEENGVEMYDASTLLSKNIATTDLSALFETLPDGFYVDEQELRCNALSRFNQANDIKKEQAYEALDSAKVEIKRIYELSKQPRPENTIGKFDENLGFAPRIHSQDAIDQDNADVFREYPYIIDAFGIIDDRHITMKEVVEFLDVAVRDQIEKNKDSKEGSALARAYHGLMTVDEFVGASQYTGAGKAAEAFIEKYDISDDDRNIYNMLMILENLQYLPDDEMKQSLQAILGLLSAVSASNPDVGFGHDCDCDEYFQGGSEMLGEPRATPLEQHGQDIYDTKRAVSEAPRFNQHS